MAVEKFQRMARLGVPTNRARQEASIRIQSGGWGQIALTSQSSIQSRPQSAPSGIGQPSRMANLGTTSWRTRLPVRQSRKKHQVQIPSRKTSRRRGHLSPLSHLKSRYGLFSPPAPSFFAFSDASRALRSATSFFMTLRNSFADFARKAAHRSRSACASSKDCP